MPYAANNKLSTSPIEGGIEITQAEYADAVQGVLDGKRVSIEGGVLSVAFPPEPEPEPEPEPSPPSAEELAAIEEAKARRLAAEAKLEALGLTADDLAALGLK